jgi:hypothetical protein
MNVLSELISRIQLSSSNSLSSLVLDTKSQSILETCPAGSTFSNMAC